MGIPTRAAPLESYEDAARAVQDLFSASGVILIVIDGRHGTGSYVSASADLLEDRELLAHFVLDFLNSGFERVPARADAGECVNERDA